MNGEGALGEHGAEVHGVAFMPRGDGGGVVCWRCEPPASSPILAFFVFHHLNGRLWAWDRVAHDGLAVPTWMRACRLVAGEHAWSVLALHVVGQSRLSARSEAWVVGEAIHSAVSQAESERDRVN